MWRVAVLACFVTMVIGGKAPTLDLNDGHKIPVVALGTGRGTAGAAPIDEVRDAVFWAIEAGYRHIDTAAVYGDEEQVGQGVADAIKKGLVKREELFITTKRQKNVHLKNDDDNEGAMSVPLKSQTVFSITYMVQIVNRSSRVIFKSKSVKGSNSSIMFFECLSQNDHFFQVNPTLTQEPLVSHCQGLGIAVMAYSPFGFLVTRKTADAPPPRVDDPTLVRIAQKYGKNTAQIVLRYLVDRGLVPIPKSANKERIAQNIDLFDFELTKEEVAEISKFNKNVRVIHPKGWEKFPNYPF
ncbi:aldo-keto reductase AKR2E4-like [Ostrinia furnacalis]|uniref:aldo-keto reductase AKR2E4-like n=1 Tax=Ostrinia furnacalis TaxID=93504 RepID=UPI00103BD09B|nr:aldo-keto reductase AKR2E4-like [Ostrinia furnacalis]